jgi:hypothetical protein
MATHITGDKRKKVETPTLLDSAAKSVLEQTMSSNLDILKGMVTDDPVILRELAQDKSFLANLIRHAEHPSITRPCDEFETVCVMRCEEDAENIQCVTVLLKDMPGFISQCIWEHIDTKFMPCGDEAAIADEDKVLDLLEADCLRDFIDLSNANKETRNYILKHVYAYALKDDTAPSEKKGEKKGEEDEEDEEGEEGEEDEEDEEDEEGEESDEEKIVRLLRRDAATLSEDEENTLDDAFGECIDEFAEKMMEDKDNLWDLLTKAGTAKGWHVPYRFTIRINMCV